MKIHELTLIFFLLMFPCHVLAGWQVAKPMPVNPRPVVFKEEKQQNIIKRPPVNYRTYINRAYVRGELNPIPTKVPNYAVSISGSLKDNIERIMRRYHWKVVWKAPYDYNFDGRVTGTSLPNVIEKLFQPFPLQAVMYMANRTITVLPRRKT